MEGAIVRSHNGSVNLRTFVAEALVEAGVGVSWLDELLALGRPVCWAVDLQRLPGAGLWYCWCADEIPVAANDMQHPLGGDCE
jgi:hypothetical protein